MKLYPCPVHEDHTPSLSIARGRDGKLLVHCFAGCDPLKILAALRTLGYTGELWPKKIFRELTSGKNDEIKRSEAARKIWSRGLPCEDTLAQVYLETRGYTGLISKNLRFHPSLKHPEGGYWPALLGAISICPDRVITGIHRIYLSKDGRNKAPVGKGQQKLSLGVTRGGAVRLSPATKLLVIAEGIETSLAIQQATLIPAWAALTAGGIERLILPDGLEEIILCADNDPSGVGLRAAERAATRWQANGLMVRIAMPPTIGTDFNDLLVEGGIQ